MYSGTTKLLEIIHTPRGTTATPVILTQTLRKKLQVLSLISMNIPKLETQEHTKYLPS